MSSHKPNRGSQSHRRQYIPEEKYDVDGTLIKNEEAFRKKRWDLKEIVRLVILCCFINSPYLNRSAIQINTDKL